MAIPEEGILFPNFFRERQNLRNRLETKPSSTRRQRKKRNRSGGVAGARRRSHPTARRGNSNLEFRAPLENRLQAEADSMPRSKATGLVNGQERTSNAAYGQLAGTPEQTGVERLGHDRTVNG